MDYTQFKVGDAVEVSTEYPFQKPVSGKIVVTDAMSCHIQIDGSPYPPLQFCRHIDDPWLGDGPDKFNHQQRLLSGKGTSGENVKGPRTGLFRLSQSQTRLNELPELVAALQRQLARLTVEVASLRGQLAEPVDPEPPRRGPGRPPKTPSGELASTTG